jgi:hypothetical protein
MDAKTIARFWRKVDKNGPVPEHRPELGPCWLWLGFKAPAGYGRGTGYGKFRYNSGQLAHRFSWMLANGRPPELLVCHRCDNPGCVRPDHLFEADQKTNVRDSIAKGRARRRVLRGAAHHAAKLTEAKVLEIRRLTSEGVRQSELAKQFGVFDGTIHSVIHRKTWAHIT